LDSHELVRSTVQRSPSRSGCGEEGLGSPRRRLRAVLRTASPHGELAFGLDGRSLQRVFSLTRRLVPSLKLHRVGALRPFGLRTGVFSVM
jgi:hypothetical protein